MRGGGGNYIANTDGEQQAMRVEGEYRRKARRAGGGGGQHYEHDVRKENAMWRVQEVQQTEPSLMQQQIKETLKNWHHLRAGAFS
jgi:hypothetical protein